MRILIPFFVAFILLISCIHDTKQVKGKNSEEKDKTGQFDSSTVENNSSCIGFENLESMSDSVLESAIEMEPNSLVVNRNDSSVFITANMSLDHRIFGFAKPDINSRRLILYSVFTCDIENNPFHCILGSFYDTGDSASPVLKFKGMQGVFAEMTATQKEGNTTIIYVKKKWISFIN
jgi:hypothetical protein